MAPENYKEDVPEKLEDKYTKKEWLELSYHQQYYRIEDDRRAYIKKKAKEIQERNRKFLKSIKSNSETKCRNCGECNSVCLEFHHVNEKNMSVSRMVKNEYSKEKMAEEIELCIVLCANCHRREQYDNLNVSNFERGTEATKKYLGP